MILANLSKAIREQNYYAVFLEFLIVIAGVLMAFQITDWSADREISKRQKAALDRLHEEAEFNIVHIQDGYITSAVEAAEARTRTLQRLTDGGWSPEDEAEMEATIGRLVNIPDMPPQRGVFDELKASGLITELGTPEMRKAVYDYYLFMEFFDSQMDQARTFSEVWNFTEPGRDGITARFAPELRRQIAFDFDFETLSRDEDFMQRIAMANSVHLTILEFRQVALEYAEAMCEEISKVSGRPCEPDLSPSSQ